MTTEYQTRYYGATVNGRRMAVPERNHHAVPPVKGPAPFGWMSKQLEKRDATQGS